jgi:hypothetical protein
MSSHASLKAGALAAVAGLLAFLAIHHLLILPIWFVLPLALPLAVCGGLAVGWAYDQLLPALPTRRWRHLAWCGGVAVVLAPSLVLAELRPAFFDPDSGDLVPGASISRVVAAFGVELLLPSTLVAAALGAALARTPRAGAAAALAGFTFALGPGHNIPLLGGTPGVGSGLALLGAIVTVSSLVLVEAHARLARAGDAPDPHPQVLAPRGGEQPALADPCGTLDEGQRAFAVSRGVDQRVQQRQLGGTLDELGLAGPGPPHRHGTTRAGGDALEAVPTALDSPGGRTQHRDRRDVAQAGRAPTGHPPRPLRPDPR